MAKLMRWKCTEDYCMQDDDHTVAFTKDKIYEEISRSGQRLSVGELQYADVLLVNDLGEQHVMNLYTDMRHRFAQLPDIPKFVGKIDWVMLRRQKLLLLEVIGHAFNTDDEQDALQGILYLIDAVQDYARDDLGIPEVFVERGDDDSNENL